VERLSYVETIPPAEYLAIYATLISHSHTRDNQIPSTITPKKEKKKRSTKTTEVDILDNQSIGWHAEASQILQ